MRELIIVISFNSFHMFLGSGERSWFVKYMSCGNDVLWANPTGK
jgi:hypothetical protein